MIYTIYCLLNVYKKFSIPNFNSQYFFSDHIIEDSVEEAILTVNKQSDDALEAEVIFAAETASEPIPKLPLENPFQILSKKKSAMAILAAADLDDQNLIQIAEECNRRSKAGMYIKTYPFFHSRSVEAPRGCQRPRDIPKIT